LTCTRMCKEMASKGHCSIPGCTYAHRPEELRAQFKTPETKCAYDTPRTGYPDDLDSVASTDSDVGIPMKLPSGFEDSNDSASNSSRCSADFAPVPLPPGLGDVGHESMSAIGSNLWRMEPAYVSVSPAFYAGVMETPETNLIRKLLEGSRKLAAEDFASTSTACSLSNDHLMSLMSNYRTEFSLSF
jgi:hypothetical protein